MLKITFPLFVASLLAFPWSSRFPSFSDLPETGYPVAPDSLFNAKSWPSDLEVTPFAGPSVVPSPACLAVAATGEVYVGVDMIGSLGKEMGNGRIVRLTDTDNDGKWDQESIFAKVDNPRGLLPVGDRLYVLYTTFSSETQKASGMDLVVFEDKNRDGVADGPSKPLIRNICSPKFLQSRGTDHATNGIRMGIDGWIYIAVGDFGFHEATDRAGNKLTQLGGGIVRVRPDGTEMEVYTHGLRNIYDVAIDPYMNIFTRDNTNDGGGWNIRFSHQIQTGEYGYPVLFKHFTEEIIPALADLGGGSGTGSIFLDDARWPTRYNQTPLMADWGRNELFIHRVSADGATFTQKEEPFIRLSQITDVDIDASGRMYLSAWAGAGYSGSPDKGFVVRAVPKAWKYEAFPNPARLSSEALGRILVSASGAARLAAQQELLGRPQKEVMALTEKITADKKLPLYARVAGMYTYAQAAGEKGLSFLMKLSEEQEMREFALRALSDRRSLLAKVPSSVFLNGLKDPSDRVKMAAIIGLGRLNAPEAASELLKIIVPESFTAPPAGKEGPHATPNSSIVLPHLAVKALVAMGAEEAVLSQLRTGNNRLALWALRYMHTDKAVRGLLSAYPLTDDNGLKKEIVYTLARLYRKEAPYDGSWWWSTRPDTHGPYYKGITWEASPVIKDFLLRLRSEPGADPDFFRDLNDKFRLGINEFGSNEAVAVREEVKVDLEAIKNKKGQVGESSIEDVMLAMARIPGNARLGKKIFEQQGCIACHSIRKDEPMKGPFMGQVGSIMNREQIAESILKPDASISQGFASVLITAKGDQSYMGFVTEESADRVVMRDIAGQVYVIRTADILSRRELENSMMPAGLANSLSYEELASLITYLSQQKE
ncbi:MAG: heme-binding protein [Cytophagaceae bacterium SCN 52-12]|nr:MAG: heme-binding protein [Cytophagaceae bacterium SCN 52-12]